MEKRFWSKVNKGRSCWEWTAGKAGKGYGIFWLDGKHCYAHRVSYEIEVGPIPEDMCVCHTCDNPGCVRPGHLFLGTHKDNQIDCSNKGRKPRRLFHDMAVIKNLRDAGYSYPSIGKMLGVSKTTARNKGVDNAKSD